MNTIMYRAHTVFLLSSVVEEMSFSCPVKRGEVQNPEGKQCAHGSEKMNGENERRRVEG